MKTNLDQPINITITAGAIIKTLAILLLAYFLYMIRDLLLVLLASIVIASAIEPGARWFMKYKFPRVLSVTLVYLIVIGIFIGIVYLFLPSLINDIANLTGSLPQYISSISETDKLQSFPALNNVIQEVTGQLTSVDIVSKIGQTLSGATVGFFSLASSIFGGFLSLILIIVLSFYLAVQDDGVGNFLKLVTPNNHQDYIIDLWRRARRKIGLWMQGQILLGLIIGILTYLGLSVLGVPNPLVLALIAGVFELIPIFGPLLSAIPAIAFALGSGGVTLGFLTLGLYLIIQQFENQLIHPLVVKKIVGIPSIVAIIALVIGAQIAGFLGMILAVPVAASVMELLHDVEKGRFRKS